MKILNKLFRSELLVPIIFLLILFVPHFYQRFFDVDGGVYAAISTSIWNGELLYSDVWDHKPPIIYLIYTPIAFFGAEIGIVTLRILLLLLALISLYLAYLILKNFNLSKKLNLIILLVVAFLVASPIFEGNFFNTENLFLPLTLFYILRIFNNKLSYLEGMLLSVAFFIKFQAFAELVLITSMLLLVWFKEIKKIKIQNLVKVGAGFLISTTLFLLPFLISNNSLDALNAIIGTNFTYVEQVGYKVNLIFTSIDFKVLLLTIYILTFFILNLLYLFKPSKIKITSKITFLSLHILLIEIFLVLYPERNYAHYLIQTIPGILLTLPIIIDLIKKSKSYFIKLLFIVLPVLFTITFLFVFSKVNITGQFSSTGYSPLVYYSSFIFNRQGKEPGYFNKNNTVEKTAKHIKDNYSKYNSHFLYTKEPWIFSLSKIDYSNKYYLFAQMYISWETFNEDRRRLLSSEVVIIQEELVIQQQLLNNIKSQYTLIESFNGYSFYIKNL